MLTAEAQGDDVRARIQTVEPLDQAAEKLQKGLRVFLRSDRRSKAWRSGSSRPGRADKGDAEVSMVLILEGGAEVEVKLPGRYKVSPQIAGAIKAVPGVLDVQLVEQHAQNALRLARMTVACLRLQALTTTRRKADIGCSNTGVSHGQQAPPYRDLGP